MAAAHSNSAPAWFVQGERNATSGTPTRAEVNRGLNPSETAIIAAT